MLALFKRCGRFVLVCLFALGAIEPVRAQPVDSKPDFVLESEFQSGVNVLLRPEHYASLEELSWKVDELLNRLQSLHVTAVSINWLIHMEGVQSSAVNSGIKTPETAAIMLLAQSAKARGLTVSLRPIIDEESIARDGKNEWRGTIRPRNVDEWFASYSAYILQYAALAEEYSLDFLVIGTELTSMEQYTERWVTLIREVRMVYGGALTYSSNQLISQTMPWHELDVISVDAFLELNAPEEASVAEIEEAWQRWKEPLLVTAATLNLPLIFTEIGVTSQVGAHRRSWIWDHNTAVSLEAQRRYYEASCRVWKSELAGMYWWMIDANIWMIENPALDASFSPLGKPAEMEIAHCFR